METPMVRLRSVDLLRGLACALMAIDHVRVYSGLPAGGPTAGIFFTRWITHFVAPAFCFFAGTGMFFHGRKFADARAQSRYLLTRGAILVALELTVIRVFWTFNFRFSEYELAGVIWMLGVCMMLMSVLTRFSLRAITIFGFVVVFAQQLVGLVGNQVLTDTPSPVGWLFQILYFGGRVTLGAHGPTLSILYSIVPWIGVMALGFAFGTVLLRDDAARRALCLRIGLGATALFVVIGGAIVATSTPEPEAPPALFRLLGQQKYPASQLFLLMTLGPTIALLPFAERARGVLSDAFVTFGRAPMFFYLLHIPLIHVSAMVVSLVRVGRIEPWLFGNHPMMPPKQPEGYMWALWLLYLVWAMVLPLLWVGCRWYLHKKADKRDGVFAYI